MLKSGVEKGDVVKAKIVCPGRLKNEMIAVADDRNITIPNCFGNLRFPEPWASPNCFIENKEVKLKITRSKHNIFYGVII